MSGPTGAAQAASVVRRLARGLWGWNRGASRGARAASRARPLGGGCGVFPDRLIPIAEETGLIVAVGEWALQEACEQGERWMHQGLELLKFAVNVSGQQLASGQLPALVGSLLERHPRMRGALVLELTEGVLIDASSEVNAQPQQFGDQGVQLSIDNFGTGYSSMNYLRHFGLDEIKIDRSFVKDLPDRQSDLSIVRAMTMLGHSLGMRVVAEGVETREQLACLVQVGVDQIQGYLIGKPMNEQDLLARAAVIAARAARGAAGSGEPAATAPAPMLTPTA